jgi:hypothetical protein
MEREPEARIRDCLSYFRDSEVFRMRKANLRRVTPFLRTSLLLDLPLRFVSHWGIGRRSSWGRSEDEALSFLKSWLDELSARIGLEYTVEFLITDTHARINGVAPESAARYAGSAIEALESHGHRASPMSDWLRSVNGDGGAEWRHRYDVSDSEWGQLPESWVRELRRCAGLRFKDADNVDEAARRYYAVNLVESAVIGHHMPRHGLISYQNPGVEFLLPPLPKIHAYVGPDHLVKRPWFGGE